MEWITIAFVLGLTGSLHCVGMCGPLALALPVQNSSTSIAFFRYFLYFLGKSLAYASLGTLFGIIGQSILMLTTQRYLSLFAGVMIILVVLIQWFKPNFSNKLPFYDYIQKKIGYFFKNATTSTFLVLGFFNGFLPCGLVYFALTSSIATGNWLNGAIFMFVFGFSTVPALAILLYFKDKMTFKIRLKLQKMVPLILFLTGSLLILRGLNLGIPYLSPQSIENHGKIENSCCKKTKPNL